jgi:predicted Fe-Mo cluster-binding NifX family protein
MKIAISSNDDKGLKSTVCEHFGKCPFFTLVTVNEKVIKKIEVVKNPFAISHQPLEIPSFLKSQGVHVILTQGMGARAIAFSQENNIKPITGCVGTIEEVIKDFLSGDLSLAVSCNESNLHHHH